MCSRFDQPLLHTMYASMLPDGALTWSLSSLTSPRAQGNGRPEYQRMLDAARKRRFDMLLVWRYDRFARSMQELVNALEEFRSLGIEFISYRENADTTTAQGKLIFGIMASLAEFERALIAERVKAGMARKGAGQARGAAAHSRTASAPKLCSASRPSWL